MGTLQSEFSLATVQTDGVEAWRPFVQAPLIIVIIIFMTKDRCEIFSAKVRYRRCVLCCNERVGRQVLSTSAASKPQVIQALCVQAFAVQKFQWLLQGAVYRLKSLKAQRLAAVARALPAACGTEDLAN